MGSSCTERARPEAIKVNYQVFPIPGVLNAVGCIR